MKFEKVSYDNFATEIMKETDGIDEEDIRQLYNKLELPKRATKGSAGYDFHIPYSITIAPNQIVKIPTGIRAKINDGYVLMIFPRSSLGFTYGMALRNTIGVIDFDYYYSDNEGHIMVKFINNSDKDLVLNVGDRFVQGIFIPFGVTEDDNVTTKRNGGFGSTNK